MSKFVKKEVQDIEISGIRQFNQQASQVDGVVSLTIGEPGLAIPKSVQEATIKAVKEHKTRYTKNKGIDELREKIAEQYEHYTSEEVILTVGSTEGLGIIMKSIIEKDDEVIIPTPGYVGYKPLIDLEQGKVVEIDTTKSDYALRKEALEHAYSNKTKAIIITSPNNPTGYTLSLKEMEVIKDFVLQKDLLLISDEIYSSIVYDIEYHSFGEFKELKDNLVILNGFSKSHAMTGFRIGYVVGPIVLINQFVKVHQYNVTSTSTISQYAALKATEQEHSHLLGALRYNRSLTLKALDELDIPYIPCNGAFYVFFDISKYNMTSLEFCDKLLYEYKVALIPGEYFLGEHKDYVRLSYAGDVEEVLFAIMTLAEFDKAHR